MLGEDEELIPALHIIQNHKKPNSQNDYQFLVSCFESLGLEDVETYLSKMLTCDYIVGNFDRHYQNFGVIRNVDTLAYTRFAPIFDTGKLPFGVILNHWTYPPTMHILQNLLAEDSVGQATATSVRLEWFEPDRLDGIRR